MDRKGQLKLLCHDWLWAVDYLYEEVSMPWRSCSELYLTKQNEISHKAVVELLSLGMHAYSFCVLCYYELLGVTWKCTLHFVYNLWYLFVPSTSMMLEKNSEYLCCCAWKYFSLSKLNFLFGSCRYYVDFCPHCHTKLCHSY